VRLSEGQELQQGGGLGDEVIGDGGAQMAVGPYFERHAGDLPARPGGLPGQPVPTERARKTGPY
jgi:hypothetical protein